jgi:hypothetical protein
MAAWVALARGHRMWAARSGARARSRHPCARPIERAAARAHLVQSHGHADGLPGAERRPVRHRGALGGSARRASAAGGPPVHTERHPRVYVLLAASYGAIRAQTTGDQVLS